MAGSQIKDSIDFIFHHKNKYTKPQHPSPPPPKDLHFHLVFKKHARKQLDNTKYQNVFTHKNSKLSILFAIYYHKYKKIQLMQIKMYNCFSIFLNSKFIWFNILFASYLQSYLGIFLSKTF